MNTETRAAGGMRYAVGDRVSSPCRLCGAEAQHVALAIDTPDRFERAAGIAADGYERYWLACAHCGLLNNHFDHDLSAVYDSAYYDPAVEGESVGERFERVRGAPHTGSDNWARVQRIKAFVEAYRAAWPGPPAPASVLDIGAGTGIFLYRALEAMPGWSGCAVEPTPQACAHLRTLAGANTEGTSGAGSKTSPSAMRTEEETTRDPFCGVAVVEGYYRGGMPELVGRSFGLVTLNKVVEHVADPVSLVRDAAAALAAGGVLYVEVPDKQTAALRPPTDNILGALHFALFDAETLARTFTQAGLSVLQVQRYIEPSGKITVSGFACRGADFVR